MATVLAIPDLHIPFHHPQSFSFLKALRDAYSPDIVVCMGDEADFHGISRWPTDPDGMSAGHEHALLLKHLKKLYGLFPNVKVCTSNHTVRPLRRAFESGIPKAFLRDYREFLEAPSGWVWQDKWYIDGVVYEHGEGVSGKYAALSAAMGNMMPTVIGHVHSFAGIQYAASHEKLIWGCNSGCLIDTHAYAFEYGKKIRNKPILGAAIIEDGVPFFHPMLLNKRGKWIGRI